MESTSKISFVPPGYPALSPYLIIKDAARAIEFYKTVFGATERLRFDGPGGTVGHAELEIAGSLIMLADEYPDMGSKSPATLGGSPVSLTVYVENVDDVFEKAVAQGAQVQRPVELKFYGDRMGTFADPFGHVWSVGTHVEDVSSEEMRRREAKFHGGGQG